MKIHPFPGTRRHCFALIILLICLVTSTTSFARFARVLPATAGLFVETTDSARREVAPSVKDRRAVQINSQALKQAKNRGARLKLNLFPETEFIAVIESVQTRGDADYTLVGRLEGQEFSSFVAVVSGEVVVMNIRPAEKGLYQVRYVAGDIHDVQSIDETQFPPCEAGPEHEVDAPPRQQRLEGDVAADSGETIDVMVVYTPSARAAAGGTTAIQALVNLAITESNTAFQQSLITPRLRLVYVGEISYAEGASFSEDLSRLRNKTDGYMDEVHALRDTHGADMVSLWVNNSASCGIAYVMTSVSSGFESSAFSTVHYTCATGYYSFVHELGHNMGCRHDRDNNSGTPLYPYSFGWRFFGSNNNEYRTIMAYAPGTRIQRFSNPDVTYFGTATGVPIGSANESHNAQTINNTASTIANFRQTAGYPVISSQPVSQTVAPGGQAVFSVGVTGQSPFTYQWRKDGDPISLATGSSYTLNNVQAGDAGTYSVIVSNALGSVTSSGATLNVTLTLAEALDAPGFNWVTGGDAPWSGQTAVSYDGVDAAASGTIPHDGFTALQTTMVGPGTLTFWWKVSSESTFDWLDLFVNGNHVYELTGEVDWTFRSVALPAGPNVIQWQYSKDESVSIGQDRGWVDRVVLIAPSTVMPHTAGTTDGRFGFNFEGLPGASYTVYGSTDLTSWSPVTNLWSSSSPLVFIDPTPTNSTRRFYRVVSP